LANRQIKIQVTLTMENKQRRSVEEK